MTNFQIQLTKTHQTRNAYFSSVDLTRNSGHSGSDNDIRERLSAKQKSNAKLAWVNMYLFAVISAVSTIVAVGL